MTEQDRRELMALRWLRSNPTAAMTPAVAEGLAASPAVSCGSHRWRAGGRELTDRGAARLAELEAQEAAERAPEPLRYYSGEEPRVGDLVRFYDATDGYQWTVEEIATDGYIHNHTDDTWCHARSAVLVSRAPEQAPKPTGPRYASGPEGDDLVPRVGDRVILRFARDDHPADRGVLLGLFEADGDVLTVRDDEGDHRSWPCCNTLLISRAHSQPAAQAPAPAMDDNEGRGWGSHPGCNPCRLDAEGYDLCDLEHVSVTPTRPGSLLYRAAIPLDAVRCARCEYAYLRRETAPAQKPDIAPTKPYVSHLWIGDGPGSTCTTCGLAFVEWHGDRALYRMRGGVVFWVLEGDLLPPCDSEAPAPEPAKAAFVPAPRYDRDTWPTWTNDTLLAERLAWLTEHQRPTHAHGRSRVAMMATPWNPTED